MLAVYSIERLQDGGFVVRDFSLERVVPVMASTTLDEALAYIRTKMDLPAQKDTDLPPVTIRTPHRRDEERSRDKARVPGDPGF